MLIRFIAITGLLVAQCCGPFGAAAQPTARELRDQPSSPFIFKEVAEEVGLRFRHYNGMTGKLFLPEIMGSGAALLDFDGDGDREVLVGKGNVLKPNGNSGERLFPWLG